MEFQNHISAYQRMTVVEIRKHLKSKNKKTSGKKSELIERLKELNIPPPEMYILQRYEIVNNFTVYNEDNTFWKSRSCFLKLYSELFDEKTSFSLYQHILDHLEIPNNTKKRFNRAYGDKGLTYKIEFRGYKGKPKKIVEKVLLPWSKIPFLSKLKKIVERITDSTYTYCVVQYYPSGKIGINPHRDREMIPGSVIAGLSLGQSRILRMTNKNKNIDLDLLNGSLYVLYPPTNDFWSHSILKDDTIHPRLSLTFRTLI